MEIIAGVFATILVKIGLGILEIILNPKHYYKMIMNKEYREEQRKIGEDLEKMENYYKEIDKKKVIKEEHIYFFTKKGPYSQENWLEIIKKAENEKDYDTMNLYSIKMVGNMFYFAVITETLTLNMREVFREIVHCENGMIPDIIKKFVEEVWNDRIVLKNKIIINQGNADFQDIYMEELQMIFEKIHK